MAALCKTREPSKMPEPGGEHSTKSAEEEIPGSPWPQQPVNLRVKVATNPVLCPGVV